MTVESPFSAAASAILRGGPSEDNVRPDSSNSAKTITPRVTRHTGAAAATSTGSEIRGSGLAEELNPITHHLRPCRMRQDRIRLQPFLERESCGVWRQPLVP